MVLLLSILLITNILVEDLGNSNYQVRLDITKQLLQDRDTTQWYIEDMYSRELNLEQRSRLKMIATHKLLERYIWDQTRPEGALGITYKWVDDVIYVNDTIIGTPGFAYLEPGDAIKSIERYVDI